MPDTVAQSDLTDLNLESLAADVVALAVKAGASEAEAVVREGDEFSVNVRMGEVETLKESGSRGLGLRVFLGTRSASASTSDLTPDGIRQLVEGAMALAKVTEEDPFTGLPDRAEFGSVADDLHLYYEDVYSLPNTERIEWARRAEAAALGADPRITNSDGGSFDAAPGAWCWPTRAALWADTAAAMPGFPRLRWPRTPTAPCSATDGEAAQGGWKIWNRPSRSARKPPAEPCGGWERGGSGRSGFPSSLRRKWRGR